MGYLKQYLLHGETVKFDKFKNNIYPKIVDFMFEQAPEEYSEDLVKADLKVFDYTVLTEFLEDYLGIKCNCGYYDEWKIGNIIDKEDEIKTVDNWNFDFEIPTKSSLNKKVKENEEFFKAIGVNTDNFCLSVSTESY